MNHWTHYTNYLPIWEPSNRDFIRGSWPVPGLGPKTVHKGFEIEHKEQLISTSKLNLVSDSICHDTFSLILHLMDGCPHKYRAKGKSMGKMVICFA